MFNSKHYKLTWAPTSSRTLISFGSRTTNPKNFPTEHGCPFVPLTWVQMYLSFSDRSRYPRTWAFIRSWLTGSLGLIDVGSRSELSFVPLKPVVKWVLCFAKSHPDVPSLKRNSLASFGNTTCERKKSMIAWFCWKIGTISCMNVCTSFVFTPMSWRNDAGIPSPPRLTHFSYSRVGLSSLKRRSKLSRTWEGVRPP